MIFKWDRSNTINVKGDFRLQTHKIDIEIDASTGFWLVELKMQIFSFLCDLLSKF